MREETGDRGREKGEKGDTKAGFLSNFVIDMMATW
jgi:hypothetical protein